MDEQYEPRYCAVNGHAFESPSQETDKKNVEWWSFCTRCGSIVEFRAHYGATPVIHVATTRSIHDDVRGEIETLRMRLSQERDAKAKKDAEIAQLREQVAALKSGVPIANAK